MRRMGERMPRISREKVALVRCSSHGVARARLRHSETRNTTEVMVLKFVFRAGRESVRLLTMSVMVSTTASVAPRSTLAARWCSDQNPIAEIVPPFAVSISLDRVMRSTPEPGSLASISR